MEYAHLFAVRFHAEPRKIEMKFKEAIETIGGGGGW